MAVLIIGLKASTTTLVESNEGIQLHGYCFKW